MRIKKTEKKVYDYLLKQIEAGILGPNSKIVEQDVGRTLGVSRSPVRSALRSLSDAGYLKLEPYKGAVVIAKQLDATSYVEQLKVFELLFIQYLFQVEAKMMSLPIREIQLKLKELATIGDQVSKSELVAAEVGLVELVLSEQANQYYKVLVLDIIRRVLETDFAEERELEERGSFLFYEHFTQLIDYLAEKKYPQGRREIRIFVNNLTLAVIDKQDLRELNKYDS